MLGKINVKWIFTSKINEKHVFINNKKNILTFIKSRFETQFGWSQDVEVI